ncbi:AMIN-like domain-containing (lipo)protein [Streptomyces violarus]|uniref:AMIN-like domain-containing (lipo)protein n=1 Tax=Streptomyces TaxID=1883 RepID=UPI00161C5777|nr:MULTISPECIES: hypothetical protein [Streptomyces]WRT96235.1 hypothetical protein VJ737_00370 [Streptomyces sp. CGMCC 4.1772]
MVRIRTACATLALVGATVGVAAVPAGAAPVATRQATQAASCPTGWGSLAKTDTSATIAPVKDIRTGRHSCFDRMVIDLPGAGGDVGYSVHYVDRLHQDGSGRHIPVTGGAVLEVRVAAPAYDPETGAATYPGRVARPLPGVDLTGYRTFRDTRFAGSFEGETQIGLGLRARLPFRVLQLDDRIIVDVAHSWTATK